MNSIREELRTYIEQEIIPQYESFDISHRSDHATIVIERSLRLASYYDVDIEIVYVAAAYHDLGLRVERAQHHIFSGQYVREDVRLREWFSSENIEIIATAAEDHRASSEHEPRTIYGKIIAEADRVIDPETTIRRIVEYGQSHYPHLSREKQYKRFKSHLFDKYGEQGYLKLWLKESDNFKQLCVIRDLIKREADLEVYFDKYFVK